MFALNVEHGGRTEKCSHMSAQYINVLNLAKDDQTLEKYVCTVC